MNLRERCQKLVPKILGYDPHSVLPWQIDEIEDFAREIRDEALEEAAQEVMKEQAGVHSIYSLVEKLRALKSEDKQ